MPPAGSWWSASAKTSTTCSSASSRPLQKRFSPRSKLIEESIIVSLVVIVFLFHFRSSLVAVLTLPLAVLLALLAMRGIGLTSNIMSLGGIAIAIGAMIDAVIIMIENAHKHVEHEESKPEGERRA